MKGTATDKICDAMLELLETKSLDRISVKELTALAGVNRSTYSYHFYDKEDVLDAIYSRFNVGLGNLFFRCFTTSEATDVFPALKEAIFTYFFERRAEINILHDAGYGAAFRRSFSLAMEELFHQMEFGFRPEGEEEILASGEEYDMLVKKIVFGIMADLEFWADFRFRFTAGELVALSERTSGIWPDTVRFKSRARKH